MKGYIGNDHGGAEPAEEGDQHAYGYAEQHHRQYVHPAGRSTVQEQCQGYCLQHTSHKRG